ncbi:BolA-like protein 3 [Perkinsus olseni]|uniref:BolA-like protein 3 n=1 Tax=Perkinsus olseni TaxID=32597 RepID=A0A7J6M1A0_PEROL|nr:BolA-like protein 3 [Perkinsus olseni]
MLTLHPYVRVHSLVIPLELRFCCRKFASRAQADELLIPHIPFIVGLPRIKQHQMVNEALKDEIKKWHAITIITKPTP